MTGIKSARFGSKKPVIFVFGLTAEEVERERGTYNPAGIVSPKAVPPRVRHAR